MYRQIADFAPNIDNEYSRNPLYYCTLDAMDAQFLHGAPGKTFGRYNKHCSEFLADRCANQWDELCEAISRDKETRFPNEAAPLGSVFVDAPRPPCLPYGEQLIRDAAFKRFRKSTKNCNVKCELFDPTVPNSPMICYETKESCGTGLVPEEQCLGACTGQYGQCQSVFTISPEQAAHLDLDPLMNKILNKPEIAMDLLEQIYFNLRQENKLSLVQNTRLGRFYEFLGHPLA
jgi:hypothetical protein